MAAKTNEDFLARVFEQLIDLQSQCKRRCHLEEKLLKDYKQLLKPWPKTKKEEPRQTIPEPTTVTAPAVEQNPELKIVEEALARAQKLHNIHDKMMGKTEPETIDGLATTVTISEEAQKDKKEARSGNQINPRTQPFVPEQKLLKKSEQFSQQRTTYTSSVIAKSRLDWLLNKQGPSHVPAHTKAPFRTASETKMLPSKRPGSGSLRQQSSTTTTASGTPRTSATVSARSRQPRSAGNRGSRSASSGSVRSNSSQVGSTRHTTPGTGRRQMSQERLPNTFEVVNAQNNRNVVEATERSNSMTNTNTLVDDMNTLQIREPEVFSQLGPQEKVTADVEKEPPFILRFDGNKIELPARMKKLCSTNNKLRQKAQALSLTVEMSDKTQHKQLFMEKVNRYINSCNGETDETFQLSMQLASIYRNLQDQLLPALGMFQSLKDGCTEASAENVMRVKRTGEFVRRTFNDLKQNFFAVDQGASSSNTSNAHQNIRRKIARLQSENCTVLDTRIESRAPHLSSHLRYKKCKQLRKHTALQFQVLMLKLERHMLDEFHASVSNLWKQSEQIPREQLELYKAVYSFLCHGGLMFPSLVEDQADEED